MLDEYDKITWFYRIVTALYVGGVVAALGVLVLLASYLAK